MVAFPRPPRSTETAKPEPSVQKSHVVMVLTAKSSHAYMGLLMLGALISDLRREFPTRTDLDEAAELIIEIANDLEIRPAGESRQ